MMNKILTVLCAVTCIVSFACTKTQDGDKWKDVPVNHVQWTCHENLEMDFPDDGEFVIWDKGKGKSQVIIASVISSGVGREEKYYRYVVEFSTDGLSFQSGEVEFPSNVRDATVAQYITYVGSDIIYKKTFHAEISISGRMASSAPELLAIDKMSGDLDILIDLGDKGLNKFHFSSLTSNNEGVYNTFYCP